jgi:hypothetical protein
VNDCEIPTDKCMCFTIVSVSIVRCWRAIVSSLPFLSKGVVLSFITTLYSTVRQRRKPTGRRSRAFTIIVLAHLSLLPRSWTKQTQENNDSIAVFTINKDDSPRTFGYTTKKARSGEIHFGVVVPWLYIFEIVSNHDHTEGPLGH